LQPPFPNSSTPLSPAWLQAPKGPERLWIGLALIWCIVMSLAMPYWHFYGKQNSSGESYRVSTVDFGARVRQFAEANNGHLPELRV